MNSNLIPYALVLLAFIVALPFMNFATIAPTGMAVSGDSDASSATAGFINGQVFVHVEAGLIYSEGRYYDYVSKKWQEFSFGIAGEEWLRNSADAAFYAPGIRPGTNFIAYYTCNFSNSWKCSGWKTANFEVL